MTLKEWFETNPSAQIKVGAAGGCRWLFFGDYADFVSVLPELDRDAKKSMIGAAAFAGEKLAGIKAGHKKLAEKIGDDEADAKLREAERDYDASWDYYKKFRDKSLIDREIVDARPALIDAEKLVLIEGNEDGPYELRVEQIIKQTK